MENCSYPRGIKRPSVMSVVGIPLSKISNQNLVLVTFQAKIHGVNLLLHRFSIEGCIDCKTSNVT